MNRLQILTGDCRDILPTLEPESVQCCVCSPPYWGLIAKNVIRKCSEKRNDGNASFYGFWERRIKYGVGSIADHLWRCEGSLKNASREQCAKLHNFSAVLVRGLRDYGTAQWEGGDLGCDHVRPGREQRYFNGQGYVYERGGAASSQRSAEPYSNTCGKCGARRIDSQLGLEPTPEEYLANMVAVFREVWRVLKPDATCWINIGDSYATSNPAGRRDSGNGTSEKFGLHEINGSFGESTRKATGLKPKDLCMMPARLAMALQADGWWLRSEIVWAKPNPMPESVTDRPTKAHEMIYLLAKQERYFYDNDTIREPYNPESIARYAYSLDGTAPTSRQPNGDTDRRKREACIRDPNPAGRNKRSVWTIPTRPFSDWTKTFRLERVPACAASDDNLRIGSPDCLEHGDYPDQVPTAFCDERVIAELSRMLDMPIDHVRSLLTLPEAFGLHRARCSLRGNWDWPRLECVVSAKAHSNGSHKTDLVPATNLSCTPFAQKLGHIDDTPALFDLDDLVGHKPENRIAVDSSPDERVIDLGAETECHICGKCKCSFVSIKYQEMSHFATFPEEIPKLCILAGSRPSDTVLDPFMGSGTTCKVALELGRKAIGIELNPAYIELAQQRTFVTPGFL